jgi:hypothetical protein
MNLGTLRSRTYLGIPSFFPEYETDFMRYVGINEVTITHGDGKKI